MTNAKGTWAYNYDNVNRLIKVTDSLGHFTQTAYDGCGNVILRTDANGNSTDYSYDDRGRLAVVTDALENITSYSYDLNGNLESITDARGKQRTLEYDALNRLVKETDPLDNEKVSEYDSVGNLVTITKPDNISINYTYDDNNRLTNITYPDQSEVSYTYDSTGKRLSMTDPNGSTTYSYDENNYLETITRDGDTITYTYDSTGNITRITYPDGMQVDYSFNELNLMDSATLDDHTLGIDYNELEQRIGEIMPNGVEVTYQYDQNGRLTLLKHQLDETELAKVAYTMDHNGNRLSITDEDSDVTNFTYDLLGQLTEVIYPDGSFAQYTYDPVGNRLMTEGDAPDVLASVSGATYLSYDYEDRLTLYQDESKTIHYTYDGDGNLIKKTVSGAVYVEEYKYLYDYSTGLPRLLVEKEGDNTYNYIYAGRLYSRIGPDGTLYYHQDGLGSILAITDEAGEVKNRYKYDAFGNPTVIQETVENSILFTGELYDQSGFIYLRARYYDPAAGRFITQDTVPGELDNPLTQNLYAYCGNNPINYLDPSGNLRCNQVDDLIYGLAISLGESLKGIIDSPLAAWALVRDIKNGNISLNDLAYALGESVAGPIKHLIANSGEVWFGDPSDAQVREYGKNLGYVIQEAIAVGGAVKTGIKAIDKLVESTKTAKKVIKNETAAGNLGVCFTGETLIKTENGHKQIQDINVGDKVFAENVETGEKGYKSVKQIFVNDAYTLLHISVKDIEIKTTFPHPFYVIDKGWIEAKDLKVGDILKLANGEMDAVKSLEVEELENPVKVYNFEVEDWHTYFVSCFNVLVHNIGSNPCAQGVNVSWADPNTSIEKQLAGKGQLKDLRSNPNLKGVDINSLIKNTPAQLEQMAKDGKITQKTLKQIKKAFEGRDLGKRGKK